MKMMSKSFYVFCTLKTFFMWGKFVHWDASRLSHDQGAITKQ